MTKDQAKDFMEMWKAGKVTINRWKFILRIFTRPDLKLIPYYTNQIGGN